MKNIFAQKCLSGAGLMIALAYPQISLAQDTANEFEDIIVTATKRAENVQDLAIAINSYTGDRLDLSGIQNTQDLQILDPSLVVTTNTAFAQLYLRGVGSDLFTPGAESSIAIFVDDVYQSRTVSAFQEFFDIEQVSVFKGPQGVLFGRNAVGGALNIATQKPTNIREGELSLSYGNFDAVRINGVINSPVLDDKVRLRVSGVYNNRDGFTDNIETGQTVDSANMFALRGQADIDVSDRVDLLLSANYSQEDSTRNLAARVNVDSGASLADLFGAIRPVDTFELALDENGMLELDSFGISAKAQIDLGYASLNSITSYRETDLDQTVDLDASQLPFATNSGFQTSDSFTQELQLVSKDTQRLEWVLGGFYLHEDASQQINNRLNFPVGPPNLLDQIGGTVETDSFGLYGNVKLNVTDKLAAQAGLRYNRDERALNFEQMTTLFDIPVTIPAFNEDEESFSAFTPRFVLEYKPAEQALIYASVSRGYKAGGFNTNVNQSSFERESLWAYELGYKNTFWDDRARFNVAAFIYDYSDLQLLTIPPGAQAGTFQSVINAAGATIKGLEGELTLALSEELTLNLGAAFLDAEFDDFVATNPNDLALGEVDRNGSRLPRAPEASINIGLEYLAELANRDLTLRGDFRYESEQFLDVFQDPLVSRDDNISLNSQIEYEFTDQVSLGLWARNITNEETVASAIRVDGLFGTLEFFLPPRTYGATLNLSY